MKATCGSNYMYHVYQARSRAGKAFLGYTTDMQRTIEKKKLERWIITYQTFDQTDAYRRAKTQELYELW